MQDSHGRTINYLRISITDRCNLRCQYCMPEGIKIIPMADVLTFEEILTIATCVAKLGVRHIKVTGGEPLVRKGCCKFISNLKKIPGIETVTLTTNGIALEEYLDELQQAGIDGINISLDTMKEDLFRMITGGGDLNAVLRAMKRAIDAGIKVKTNTVSLDWSNLAKQCGYYDIKSDWKDMIGIAKEYPVDVRFIEVMPIGFGKDFETVNHKELIEDIKKLYPEMKEDNKIHGFGPARYYHIPRFQGSIGFISAIHGKFCNSCNRVRLTAQGHLKTCLCYEDGVNLREILRSEVESEEKLTEAIRKAILQKAEEHSFENPDGITERKAMSSIGG